MWCFAEGFGRFSCWDVKSGHFEMARRDCTGRLYASILGGGTNVSIHRGNFNISGGQTSGAPSVAKYSLPKIEPQLQSGLNACCTASRELVLPFFRRRYDFNVSPSPPPSAAHSITKGRAACKPEGSTEPSHNSRAHRDSRRTPHAKTNVTAHRGISFS